MLDAKLKRRKRKEWIMTVIVNPDRDLCFESRLPIAVQILLKSPEECIKNTDAISDTVGLHFTPQLRRYFRKLALIEHQSKYAF